MEQHEDRIERVRGLSDPDFRGPWTRNRTVRLDFGAAHVKLTAKEDPETIKRYAHVKRARGWRSRSCGSPCAGTSYTCTRARDHRGPHVAHGGFRKVAAVWEDTHGTPRSTDPVGRRSGTRSVARRGADEAPTLRRYFARVFSSPEEVIFGVMFLAFVWFAIDWLLLIFG
jgi:hypothetical protein